ncbi:MAG: arylamine N-acetyltransferase [Bryobacteraceae bacterium]
MVAGELQRYLRLLGIRTPIARPARLGETGLNEIVQRHLCRVPFENVSKLLLLGREGAGRVTTLAEFLDGVERYDLGGTCYTANPFLASLLSALGYDADLLGADMSKPNVHTSIRVRLSGVAYHVDVGYGAPFRGAIRLDRLPWEFEQGCYRFVFGRAEAPEAYQARVYSGGQRLHGYIVHPPARDAGFFDSVAIESYRPGMTFTSMLRIIRFFDGHAADLQDTKLSIHRGRKTTSRLLRTMQELRAAVADDLAMPRCPIEEAVAVLEQQTGRSVFEEKGRAGAC